MPPAAHARGSPAGLSGRQLCQRNTDESLATKTGHGMSDETPDYAELTPPADRAASEYTWQERRAEIFQLIEEAGHPRNLRRNQNELADRYGVSQQQISKDIKRLREYQKDRAGDWAISTTRWLGDKTVHEIIEHAGKLKDQAQKLEQAGEHSKAAQLRETAANLWSDALNSQMEYNDFLFQLGKLEEAPDEIHISGDAGEAYMSMLREAHEEQQPDE